MIHVLVSSLYPISMSLSVNISDEPAVDIGCSDSVLLCSVEELSDSAKSVEPHAEKNKKDSKNQRQYGFFIHE